MSQKQHHHFPPHSSAELEPQTLPGVAPAAAVGLLPTLAAGIAPISPPSNVEAALRERLFSRVARSAAANKVFHTVRRDDGTWQAVAPGVSVNIQHADARGSSRLIRLAPGAIWRVGDAAEWGSAAHECLVLQGEARVASSALASPTLAAQDYQFIGADSSWLGEMTVSAPGGALLYWRISEVGVSEFGHTKDSHLVRAGMAG